MRIAVAGAGIAGLTAAAGLALRGHQVRVHEARSRAEYVRGSFFMVDEQTLHRVRTLIDQDALLDASVPIDGLQLGDDAPRRRPGLRQFDRARLLRALLHTAQHHGATVDFRSRIDQLTVRAEGAYVSTEHGTDDRPFDHVIGCDGTFSRVRAIVEPDVVGRYCGQQVLYATMPGRPANITAPDDTVHFLPAPDGRATLGYVYSPARDATSWFARVTVGEHPALAAQDLVDAAVPLLSEPAATLIAELGERSDEAVATRAYNVTLTGRIAQTPVVPLIGDADHAITPAAASGAKDAFIDALTVVDGIDTKTVAADLAARRDELRRARRALVDRSFPGVIE